MRPNPRQGQSEKWKGNGARKDSVPKASRLRLSPHGQRQLENLVNAARRDGLVLFVGAGINGNAIPQWGSLLQELVERAIREAALEDQRMEKNLQHLITWCRSNFDPCSQASLVKAVLGQERFRLEIQKMIYREIDYVEASLEKYCKERPAQEQDKFELLRAVAELCLNEQVRAVVTFNYDDLLEIAVRKVGDRIPCSYYGANGCSRPRGNTGSRMLPVFHVHGLVSAPGAMIRDLNESPVMASDSYFELNADPLSWETSTPIHLLRHHCSLWLGASLKDWNMLRLLHAARAGGAAPAYCFLSLEEVKKELAFEPLWPMRGESGPKFRSRVTKTVNRGWDSDQWLPEFKHGAMRIHATLLRNAGIELITVGNRFSDVVAPVQAVRDLLQKNSRRKEKT